MLLKESIRKVLKEETAKTRLITMIENDGLLHTLKLTNLNFSRLSSLLGSDWITRKIQIKFIKDLMALRLYGFGLGEAGLDPIYYNENEEEYRQIDYIGERGVTIDVIPKNDFSEGIEGDWFQSYFGLEDKILNEVFNAMITIYENNPEFFSL
jgi:hypothetical protein